MAILNPRFQDAGPAPGQAAHWTIRSFTSRRAIAGFGPVPEEGWDGYERWFTRLAGWLDVGNGRYFFEGSGNESFENRWSGPVYLREMPEALLVPSGSGAFDVASAAFKWSEVNVASEKPSETFESGWRSNELSARVWDDVPSSGARFDGGVDSVETFNGGVWPPL